MAVAAHFEYPDHIAGTPRAQRRRLLFETAGSAESGEPAVVTVHNVSATGLLLETRVPLGEAERIEVDLPELGLCPARVMWSDGGFYGCRFDNEVSPAVLSAIELRARRAPDAPPLPTSQAESFAARLVRLRKGRGFSQSAVAAHLGLSKPTVWAWEQGRARPTEAHLAALAALLDVAQDELAGKPDGSRLSAVALQARQQIADALQVDYERIRILLEL